MRRTFRLGAWGCRVARTVVLGAGVLALTGCATGYMFVHPDGAGGGGYYTSDGAYPGPGYYDDYGTGAYYPGTRGYGYYDATSPYPSASGWYDGYYGGYGYRSSFIFSLGVSNVWGFPGYWGPWYSGNFPIWGCGWGCRHGWRHDHHGRQGDHDPVATAPPRPWLKPDHPRVPPRHGPPSAPLVAIPARPAERFPNRRPLPSATFVPHDFARAPISRIAAERFVGMPVGSVARPRVAAEPGFVNRRELPMPVRQEFRAAPHPVARPAPAPGFAPAARPPPRRADSSRTEIP